MRRITNRHKILAIIIGSLLSLAISNCAIKESAGPDKALAQIQAGESWQTIQSGQTERRYLLYVPAAYDDNTPVPLVLNFHGSGGNPVAQLAYSDFGKLAEDKGFVIALPLGQYNNRGLNSWNTVNDPDAVNDVQLVRDIIDGLSRNLSIDPKRIYATGMSGGARMASRLACEMDDMLAAVSPVAGIQFPSDCRALRAVPIITFHGKKDVVNTYGLTDYSPPYWTAGVEESLAGWVDKNGCAKNPETLPVSDAVARVDWENCRDGAEIVFYRIEDGGHTWPGSSIVLTKPWSGKTSKDIVASQLIWEFFEAHPLP